MNYYQLLQGFNYIQSLYENHQKLKLQLATLQLKVDSALRNNEDCEQIQETKHQVEAETNKHLELAQREEAYLLERLKNVPSIKNSDTELAAKLFNTIVNDIKVEQGMVAKKDKHEGTLELTDVPQSITHLCKKYRQYCNVSAYKSLLPYTKLAYFFETKGDPEEHAFKLATLLGSQKKALEYIRKFGTFALFKQGKISEVTLLHDAALFILPPEDKCDFKAWCKLAQQLDFMLDYNFREMLSVADVIENQIKRDVEESKRKISHKDPKIRENEIIRLEKQRSEITNLKRALSPKLREWRHLKANQHKVEHGFDVTYQKLSREISELRLALAKAYAGTLWNKADLDMFHAYYECYVNQKPGMVQYLGNQCSKFSSFVKKLA